MQDNLFPAPPTHNPGGKVTLRPAPGVTCGACYGDSDVYRYRLWRAWGPGDNVLVVMMNPSTATAEVDDPTVAKVTKMARRWRDGRFGTLLVGNVFAYRATQQADLATVTDPVGPDNDAHLAAMADTAAMVVFAYGTPKIPRLRDRGQAVAQALKDRGHHPYTLRLSKDGVPWHPLYLRDDTEPVRWAIA